ncbi:MAG: hypothetical protein Q8R70_00305, partial [Methanoregula sp.]|nr:hypothetical protein [Methanoregula sp.]
MPHRSWKAALAHKQQPQPDPVAAATLQRARQVQANIEVDTIIERQHQARIYQDLKRLYHGDVPVRECWNHIADGREAETTTGS